MDEPMSDSHFKLMSFTYKFRDLFLPRKNILKEVGIKPGFHVLDYGCGPGSYITDAAKLAVLISFGLKAQYIALWLEQ